MRVPKAAGARRGSAPLGHTTVEDADGSSFCARSSRPGATRPARPRSWASACKTLHNKLHKYSTDAYGLALRDRPVIALGAAWSVRVAASTVAIWRAWPGRPPRRRGRGELLARQLYHQSRRSLRPRQTPRRRFSSATPDPRHGSKAWSVLAHRRLRRHRRSVGSRPRPQRSEARGRGLRARRVWSA